MRKYIVIAVLLAWVVSCKKTENVDSIVPVAVVKDLEIPVIDIKTDNLAAISSKTTYISGQMTINGVQKYKTLNEKLKIKGRGNHSWELPKKPYHIEFEKSLDLFGFGQDKDYLLIANYLDFNHMANATGFTLASLLEMPFTCKFKPVEVSLNGNYQGLYLLTQQVEKENNRVNIDDLGALVELDTYYNDPNKFKTSNYALPINIKYPKMVDANLLAKIKADFNVLDAAVASAQFPNNNLTDILDLDSFCNYMLLTYLTENREINHPKSTFMHKNATGKIFMGPVWDFDWAMGFDSNNGTYYNGGNSDVLQKSTQVGAKFFTRIMTAPIVRARFKEKWLAFKADKMDKLMNFVDTYSKGITTARQSDISKWNLKNLEYSNEIVRMKNYLNKRASYIDNMVQSW